MIQILCRIFSSPVVKVSRPPTEGLTGNDHPLPNIAASISASDTWASQDWLQPQSSIAATKGSPVEAGYGQPEVCATKRRHECRRGTHECVRHENLCKLRRVPPSVIHMLHSSIDVDGRPLDRHRSGCFQGH